MIKSLYLRILKHWIMALLITEILIFAFFILVVGDSHRQYVINSVGQSSLVARDFMQAAVAAEVAQGSSEGDALRTAAGRLAQSARARVWVKSGDGKVVAASFTEPPPVPEIAPDNSGRYGDVQVGVAAGKEAPWYAVAPLTLPGHPRPLALHLLSQPREAAFPVAAFAGGLALIGLLAAILAVPLTLRITRPLNRLQESALRIAGGDLTARADITQRDEIGRLASAFNSMAETVERMVRAGKELTANVSHELRSPLARIRVAGECLRDAVERGDQEDAREMVQAICEDIDEADAMIGGILQFSRLDLQEPFPVMQEILPADLVSSLARTLAPLARSKDIRFDLDLSSEQALHGDEQWLRTAFKNLLENAVRHTAAGGRVEVALRDEKRMLVVEVTNSHAPLPEEELELIFTPFYRGKESRGEGTGLGLAIARKIIVMHGGAISARNVARGFQVRVALPREQRQV